MMDRRRMGLVAVREMARHRYRQSQFVARADALLQLDERSGASAQVQRQGAQRAEARAELSVELAQARILPAYELGR
jgi:multidrug efflux pump subunit AcrA (membrane-fusion protein)